MTLTSNKYKPLFVIILVLILLASTVSSYNTDEYLNEFSNKGEECNAIDIFEYREWDPKWWNNNNFRQTIPIFYSCCKDDSCTSIIVDIIGKKLMKDEYFLELIDLNYIKYSLSTGDLTKTSFVTHGLDSCYFHGQNKLNKESLNLVADTAEEISTSLKTKRAKQTIDIIHTARALELISPFSLADFGVSVACKFNDKKIKKAIEKIAECNLYLSNIQNNFAQTGYVYRLDNCLDEARKDFGIYREDYIAMAKHGTDSTINFFHAVWNFFVNLFNNPEKAISDFHIEETEYDIAGRIYNEIKDKKLYLYNPNKQTIWDKYASRIIQKRNDFSIVESKVSKTQRDVDNFAPNSIRIYITNIFFEPNYNISGGLKYTNEGNAKYSYCYELYNQVKYNSAIKCLEDTNILYNKAKDIIDRELKVLRLFDNRWKTAITISIILFFVLLVSVGYILRKMKY